MEKIKKLNADTTRTRDALHGVKIFDIEESKVEETVN